MEDLIQSLIQILREELAIYRELLLLSQKKKKLLLEKFSTELSQIAAEEERQAQRLAELEETRVTLVFGLTGKQNASLDEAVETIEDTTVKSDLWMLGSQLRDTISEIRLLNEDNQRLLEQALELTQYTLKLITTPARENTYKAPGKPGKADGSPAPALIDRKA